MISAAGLPLGDGTGEHGSLDVAVIGAGISGLYTGYRLLGGDFNGGHHPPKTVQIFELSDRIGGRLESIQLPGSSVHGELGGMRYLTQHVIVTTLIEQVFANELEHLDFPMGDPKKLFFYMRGQRFRASAWSAAQKKKARFQTRYDLGVNTGFSSDQLFNKITYDVVMADRAIAKQYGKKLQHPDRYTYNFLLTREDWAAIKPVLRYRFPGPYNGMRVADMGFWNLIADQTSNEAFQFLSDAGGYYSMTINWNAAEALPYVVGDFSQAGILYRTIKGGYDQIAFALARAFCAGGGTIWTRNRLAGVTKAPPSSGRKYRLAIDNHTGTRWHVDADRVVLALPRRSLELLGSAVEPLDPAVTPDITPAIRSSLIEPSYKILLGFTHPWWKDDFGALSGESVTDLPMRQCYYFGIDPKNGHSLFLSSYNDMRTVTFWRALERSRPFAPKRTRRTRPGAFSATQHLHAPNVMVDEVMRQVRLVHGHLRRPIPDPYVAFYRDWSRDPYGGGYHGWDAGVDVKRVMPYMRRPNRGEDVYICGETYSEQQGWVEGALCTAERMLQEHFGMAWPKWLPRDYFLGW